MSYRSVRRLLTTSAAAWVLTFALEAVATEYYVAPTGSDSADGTADAPFATLQKGHDVSAAGDTVWIHGGTYAITTPKSSSAGIVLSKSGTSDTSRIKFWAVDGELPVFDFANLQISTSGYTNGFNVSGSWLHIKGVEIKNVPMNTSSNNGMSATGSNNIFEHIDFHHNNGTGLFINGGNGGNLILNCDSHDNYDPTSSQGDGQNADGFGVHYQMSGPSTIIRGCRAWWNSDDGYDFINHEVPVITENSWAMGNGYIESGSARPADGNGNGFKAGSSKTGIRHVISNCLAWGNVASGFYANHSLGGNTWYNNTAYMNGTQYNMLATDPVDSSGTKVVLTGDKVHIMRNNIGFPNKNSNMEGVDSASNSWDLSITPANSDFLSVDDAGGMTAPRQADGSLPVLDFMKLSAASKMIDKGVDVDLPFAGAAPDLGCYESGLVAAGSGGMGGSAGMPGGAGTNSGAGSGGTSNGGNGAAAGSGAGGPGAGGMTSAGGDSAGATPGAGTSGTGGTTTGTGGVSTSGGVGGSTGGVGGTGTGGTTNPGAGNGTNPGSGGRVGQGGSSTGSSGVPGAAASGESSDDDEASNPAGCGCTTAGSRDGSLSFTLAALALAAFGARRRRAA